MGGGKKGVGGGWGGGVGSNQSPVPLVRHPCVAGDASPVSTWCCEDILASKRNN